MKDNYIINRINQLCEKKHMSYYELSKRAGITQSSLSNLINKGCTPKINTLEKLCDGFGITLAQFFTERDGIPDLSEEQRQLLREWGTLSPREKAFAKKIFSSIKELR